MKVYSKLTRHTEKLPKLIKNRFRSFINHPAPSAYTVYYNYVSTLVKLKIINILVISTIRHNASFDN